MKRFVLILFVVLVAGCSKNSHPVNTVPQLESYIFFDADVIKTKSNLLEDDHLPYEQGTSFGVMGLKGTSNAQVFDMYDASEEGVRFDNVAVMYRKIGGSTDPFVYDKLALWTSEAHSFYAFYPYNSDLITNFAIETAGDKAGIPYISYEQPDAVGDMTDILTALTSKSYSATATAAANLVNLTFAHRLFAFDVIIKNNLTSDLVVTDAVVSITEVTGDAKFYFDGTLDSGSTRVDYKDIDYVTEDITIDGKSGESGVEYVLNGENSFLFLPCDALNVSVTIKFKNLWNQENEFTYSGIISDKNASGTAVPYAAGTRYALVINRNLVGGTVTFTPELVTGWDIVNVEHEFN